jgi:hypothetical protein
MNTHTKTLSAAFAITILLSACSLLGPKVKTQEYVTDDGVILVESVKLTATVKAIDQRNRTLTLDRKFARDQKVKASAEMANFDQIRVGDELEAEIIEETAVSLVPGGAPESAGALEGVALAPVGDKPALGVVSSRELTADIVAIDSHSHKVTLEFIDGSTESFKVGKHIDLSTVSLHDSVRIVVTDAIAIEFHKKN